MSEKRFKSTIDEDTMSIMPYLVSDKEEECFYNLEGCVDLLNEQQELIEELKVSDEMGWKRAERFEKKCPKELYNKKMYIKRLEYKVQKFKEENEQLRRLFEEMKQPITINLTEEDEKELRKLLGLIDDE